MYERKVVALNGICVSCLSNTPCTCEEADKSLIERLRGFPTWLKTPTAGKFFFLTIVSWIAASLSELYAYVLFDQVLKPSQNIRSAGLWLALACGCSVLVASVYCWFGRAYRPRYLGTVVILTGLVALATSIPGKQYSTLEPVADLLCSSRSGTLGSIANLTWVSFILLPVLIVVNLSLWSLGISYLDDFGEKNTPIGFVGSVVSVKLTLIANYANFSNYVTNNPGKWFVWLVVFGLVLVVFGILMLLFPRTLGGKSADVVHSSEDEEDYDTSCCHTLLRLLLNPVFVLTSVSLACLNSSIVTLLRANDDYSKVQYHVPSEKTLKDGWTSSIVNELFFVPFLVLLILRFQNYAEEAKSPKRLTFFNVWVILHNVAIIILFGVSYKCAVNTPLAGMESGTFVAPLCSQQCGCSTADFAPVCVTQGGSNRTYFSPCHAGCSQREPVAYMFEYTGCTCGPNPNATSQLPARVVRGSCLTKDCFSNYNWYLLMSMVNVALFGGSVIISLLLINRSVIGMDKAAALVVAFSIIGFVKYLLADVLVQHIDVTTCAFWGEKGCKFHNSYYVKYLISLTASLAAISAVTAAGAGIFARNLNLKRPVDKDN